LHALTEAFGTVRDAVRIRDAPVQDLPLSAYDIAVERVCRNCRVNEQCWNREYEKTRTALNAASGEIRRRGRAHAEDFPPHFAARCENLAEFVANVNENLALRESRSRYRRRAADDTRLLRAQYDAMAQVLEEVSAAICAGAEPMEEETAALRRALSARGIALQAAFYRTRRGLECRIHAAAGMPRMLLQELEELAGEVCGRPLRFCNDGGETLVLREQETLRAVVGVGLRQRRGEEESGDSAAYFRTEEGKLYLILADGMGTGGHAARESAAFVRMLEGFLRAGVSVHGALRLLSPAFAVKNGGDSFTTCDILEVDLHTGESACYKCGAAPTYLCARDERGVRRISSGSMPVGLPEEMPETDRTRLQLEVGDLLVMVSDGLSEPEGDQWLTEYLSAHRFTSATSLAAEILEAGEARGCDRDDMTVLVLKLSAMRS
ncbi:MAG: hypothetical protein E7458_06015, partial [Ruminococcaceae bacterium]|nr:hypothetical protein [Oscillospiraceae bacterium]